MILVNYKLQLNMIQSKSFFNVNDIMSFMSCGKSRAYRYMREIKSNYPGFGNNRSKIRTDVFLDYIHYNIDFANKIVSLGTDA